MRRGAEEAPMCTRLIALALVSLLALAGCERRESSPPPPPATKAPALPESAVLSLPI